MSANNQNIPPFYGTTHGEKAQMLTRESLRGLAQGTPLVCTVEVRDQFSRSDSYKLGETVYFRSSHPDSTEHAIAWKEYPANIGSGRYAIPLNAFSVRVREPLTVDKLKNILTEKMTHARSN